MLSVAHVSSLGLILDSSLSHTPRPVPGHSPEPLFTVDPAGARAHLTTSSGAASVRAARTRTRTVTAVSTFAPPAPQSAFHPAPALILSCHLLKTLQQLLVTPSKRHSPQGPTSLCVTSPPLPDLSPGPTSPGALVTHSPEYLSVSPPPGLSHTCSSLCPEGPSPQGPHGLCFPSSQSPMDRV